MKPLTTLECIELTSKSAEGKASSGSVRLLVLGILAGMFIAFGGQGSLMGSFNLLSNPETIGLGKLVMGCIFPVGLMLVVVCGAELFTGNCLMITGILDKKIGWAGLIRNWIIVYIGNFLGSLIIVSLMAASGLWNTSKGLLGAITINTAISKCSMDFGRALTLGILCNILVCLAVLMSTCAREVMSKLLAIWFCIMLFVVSGFEHSVANMYFIPAGIVANAMNREYAQILNLNTAGLDLYGFFVKNLIPVTLGNIIGGVFVGAVYWFCCKKLK